MHPVLRMITHPSVALTARNVWSYPPRWTRSCEAVAGAVQDRCTKLRSSDSTEPSQISTFACVGIDSDMNGAIVLVTCRRNDSIMHSGLGEGQTMVRTPANRNGQTEPWYVV